MTAESLIETVDGPVAIGTLVGKSMPVLTRLPNGAVGFRLMTKIAGTGTAVPVVRLTFDNGQSVVTARTHRFVVAATAAGTRSERAAEALTSGTLLETSFHFPAGYELTRMDGTAEPSAGAVRVTDVADEGTAEVFGGHVNETHCYFTTAGVLCRERAVDGDVPS